MATYFMSRHPAAIEWARLNLSIDAYVHHCDVSTIKNGDTIYGILPLPLVAKCILQGARYFHLELMVSEHQRGQELRARSRTFFDQTKLVVDPNTSL